MIIGTITREITKTIIRGIAKMTIGMITGTIIRGIAETTIGMITETIIREIAGTTTKTTPGMFTEMIA